MMKTKNILHIAIALLLTACSEETSTVATEQHPNGAIELRAGIVEGDAAAVTRAGAETYHGSHHAFKSGVATALALSVRGSWTGKGDDPSSATPNLVTKSTTATVTSVATESDDKHNNVSCTPVLYWDDYGTADPDNTAGRTEGLTIYGAAIDGKTTAPTVSDWTALSWTLPADQTSTGNTPADKDLLISNNVQPAPGATTSNDGTYKFDDYIAAPTTYTKLLEFRHALSKITVNLKAGKGFPVATGESDAHFEETPEVKLTSNEGTPVDASAWPFTTGTVDITTGVWSSQGNNAAITMSTAASLSATAPTGEGYTVTKEALVIPGSEFSADDATILRINADGNIYYVTAEKIRAAITSKSLTTGTGASEKWLTLPGKNYVINVIVNKTEIKVTASVVDWTTVKAEEVAPKINITVDYGWPGTQVNVNKFSFYRSLSLNNGYATGESENFFLNGYYKRISELTKNDDGTWTMNPKRYWSHHNQHYHFRLVWPNTTTAKKFEEHQTDYEDPVWHEYFQRWRPHVEDKEYDGTTYQVIEIWNDPFQDVDASKTDISDDYHPYPSNLAIARPEFDDPETTADENLTKQCTNNEPGHTRTYVYDGGICATEGEIDLTFRFVMSQVEVRLTTTTTSSAVRLQDATVELVNAYTKGYVKLGDRVVETEGDKTTYGLDYWKKDNVESTETYFFRSAIVPQPLTYTTAQASTNLRFKVTITNADDTKDVYYADVEPILNSAKTAKVAPNGKWESGVHYIYNLNVSKTEIKVTATLATWTDVEAAEEVWF